MLTMPRRRRKKKRSHGLSGRWRSCSGCVTVVYPRSTPTGRPIDPLDRSTWPWITFRGKTLEAVLHDAGGRASWSQVVTWGIALCDVLTYLHSQAPPYIFRDMKLQNVLLDDRTRRPVLIDFGIARQLAPAGGTAIGTWGYVPYEQILGRAEPRSDVYALGATLHALLTGRQPDAEYTRGCSAVVSISKRLYAPFFRVPIVSFRTCLVLSPTRSNGRQHSKWPNASLMLRPCPQR